MKCDKCTGKSVVCHKFEGEDKPSCVWTRLVKKYGKYLSVNKFTCLSVIV